MAKSVLLTGISGFIAKRIALDLLNQGHTVRGSLRSMRRADEVRDALRPHLTEETALERLSFVELDLNSDDGWQDAAQGVDVLMHTASPFPIESPTDEMELIRPAVDGTLRALRAARAAGVTRVVLTSSIAAIHAKDKTGPFTEDDWSEADHPLSTPYYKSKTQAERAAWDFVAEHPEMQLSTINPGLVLGTPMDAHYGSSLSLVERILSGKDPMLPNFGLPVVDVADVSAMHIKAMETPDAIGKRFIAAAGASTFPKLAEHLAAAHPDRKITTRIAPKWLLRVLSLFDPSIRTVLPAIGVPVEVDNSRAKSVLGIDFTPVNAAVDRAADAVLAKG